MHCPACAGKHDYEECRNRGNNRYMQYERVRQGFAKEASFNYRRDNNRDYRDQREQHGRRYVDERLEIEDGWGRAI
jgi:hypothetical protein